MPEPDLLSLVRVAGTAVPVAVAASALETSPGSIMSAAQELVASNRLADTPDGYQLVDDRSVEVSPTMAAYLSGRLADAFAQSGGEPLVTGRLLIAAGRPSDAWDVLGTAALDARVKRSDLEQLALFDLALEALERAHLDGGSRAADVRLQVARLRRAKGETAAAKDAIEQALPSLTGEHLVDGLGFAASIADDLQLPQESERWVALAAMSAANLGLNAKLGSLLTFQGRELSRLGFASEAQAALSKGNALLERHGSEIQRFYGLLNRAWVDLDQGQMRSAEMDFARLREMAEHLEGEASQADKEAYWARTLFGSGRPDLALEAIDRAVTLARRVQAPAPEFISAMARAEGGILYEQWDYAEAGAREALEFADTSLPSWKNVGHYLMARALGGSGQREGAFAELEAALAFTPEGSNGTRWRTRIDGLSLALSDTWDGHKAEDLTDLLLQSNWLGAAAELMITRAIREKDPDLAAEAAALAMEIGNPALAAQAIRAGQLWGDALALPVVGALRSIKDHLPEGWDFMSEGSAEAALVSETEAGPDELALLRARIEDALTAAGLSGDMVLSPAQRRAGGQVRRRRRRRSPLGVLAGAVAAAAIAVVSAIVVVNLTTEPPAVTVTTRPQITTTAAPVLEQTLIAPPEAGLFGSASFRGDPGRTGVLTGGFRNVMGRYWEPRTPGGFFFPDVPPIAFGNNLYVATDENFIYGIEQRNGRIILTIPSPTSILSPIAVDQPGGESDSVLVFGGADQMVHAYSALEDGLEFWQFPTAEVVRAAPLIVDDTVYIADIAGFLYALNLSGGDLLWQHPSQEDVDINGEPEGTFRSAPAFADGIIYAVTQDGLVHMVNASDGTPACGPVDVHFDVLTNPVISGGAVFVGLGQGGMTVFAAGTCGAAPGGYQTAYPIERPVRRSPAVTPELMFYIEDRRLHAIHLDASLWGDTGVRLPSPWLTPYSNDQLITTHPVLADGVVYIGTQEGVVLAIDAETGEKLWEFSVGAAVRGEPLVVPGAVFIGNAAGEIWAIAGE
jgi:outer membrane protein assembly factor BamB/tetratricopeptide (TPR) repeat protein